MSDGRAKKTGEVPTMEYPPALRPRKRVFVGLCVLFGAWVVFLLVLYWKTVHPMRRH